MSEILTRAEIEQQYPSEWILIGDPELAETNEVLRGKVLWHSDDRDEVYGKAGELRLQSAAFLYTGAITEGAVLVL